MTAAGIDYQQNGAEAQAAAELAQADAQQAADDAAASAATVAGYDARLTTVEGDLSTLDGAAAKKAAAETITGAWNLAGGFTSRPAALPGTITVKPSTDLSSNSVVEWLHDAQNAYLLHLIQGPNMGGSAALIGLGVDHGGIGLFVNNKATGQGVRIRQRDTISDAQAYGLMIVKEDAVATAMRLELQQGLGGAGRLSEFLAFGAPADTDLLTYWGDPAGTVGEVRAMDGRMRWSRNIVVRDKDGATRSTIQLTQSGGVLESRRHSTFLGNTGAEWWSWSGTDSLWWGFRFQSAGSYLRLQTADASADPSAAAYSTVMELQHNKLGFFGATPAAKPTGVAVTAAGIHAALVTLGLIAA